MSFCQQILDIKVDPVKAACALKYDNPNTYYSGHRKALQEAAKVAVVADDALYALQSIARADDSRLTSDPLWAKRIAQTVLEFLNLED